MQNWLCLEFKIVFIFPCNLKTLFFCLLVCHIHSVQRLQDGASRCGYIPFHCRAPSGFYKSGNSSILASFLSWFIYYLSLFHFIHSFFLSGVVIEMWGLLEEYSLSLFLIVLLLIFPSVFYLLIFSPQYSLVKPSLIPNITIWIS